MNSHNLPARAWVTAHTQDGKNLQAEYVTDSFISPTEADLYLLQNVSPGFSCNQCNGFHFIQNPGSQYATVQFNDRVSGDAYSYLYPRGTFQQYGQFSTTRGGSGTGNLAIADIS